jgi:hypothetical protein
MLDEQRVDRVRARTPGRLNARIDARTQERLSEAAHLGPVAREKIIARLDREWDIDRAMMLLLSIAGTVAHEVSLRGPRWVTRILRGQLAFLGIYALFGWAPPVPILRLLGCRTKGEIAAERQAMARITATA